MILGRVESQSSDENKSIETFSNYSCSTNNQSDNQTYGNRYDETNQSNMGKDSMFSNLTVVNATDVYNYLFANSSDRNGTVCTNHIHDISIHTNVSTNGSACPQNKTNISLVNISFVGNFSSRNEDSDENATEDLYRAESSEDLLTSQNVSYSDGKENPSYRENETINVASCSEKEKILQKVNESLSEGKPVFLIFLDDNTNPYSNLENKYGDKITFLRVKIDDDVRFCFNLSSSPMLFLIKNRNESGYLYLEINPEIEIEKLDSILYFAANNIFTPTSYGTWYRDKRIYHRIYHNIDPEFQHFDVRKVIQPAINKAWKYLDPYEYIGTNKMDATMFSAFKVLYSNFRKDPKILKAYKERVFDGKKRIADRYLFQLNFFFNLNLSEDRFARKVIESDFLQSGMLTINELILRAFYSDEVPYTDEMFSWVLNNFSKRGGYDLTHSIMVYAILRERGGYDAEKIEQALDELCELVVEEQEEDHSRGSITDFDLYAERVGFLIIANRCDLIKEEWIEKIISFQNEDGGFPLGKYGEESHAHSTYVALLALMGYKKYVLEHRGFDFSFTKPIPVKKPYIDSRFSTKFLEELDKKGKVKSLIKLKESVIPPWMVDVFGKNITVIDTSRGKYAVVEITKDILDL